MFPIIVFLLFIIFIYCSFVIFFRIKLIEIEYFLQILFKKRNYKVASLYFASEDFLTKHNEIFKDFIVLKQKDFEETRLNFTFENKFNSYKRFDEELNFIFKICETNSRLKQDEKYNYIKEEILKETKEAWKQYKIYKIKFDKYKKHHKISKFFLVWLFLK